MLNPVKKIFILAGEPSGDLHGSTLVEAIKKNTPNVEIQGWGGDRMELAGVRILKHYRDTAFMGFVEVIKHLPQILRNFKDCKKQIASFQPDCVVFIDYPGFNLRMLPWVHQQRIRTLYYITPTVWAWDKKRIHLLGKFADICCSILPFEPAFFQQHGYHTEYVGNPLVAQIQHWKAGNDISRQEKKVIALLPGSRLQEVTRILPVMCQAAKSFPEFNCVIAATTALPPQLYSEILTDSGLNAEIWIDQTYSILAKANCAFVTSGTATLETALFRVPMVVCYIGSTINVAIARMLVKIKFISLVNLIAEKEIVPELIQEQCTSEQLVAKMERIMQPVSITKLQKEYEELSHRLTTQDASQQTAHRVLELCEQPMRN